MIITFVFHCPTFHALFAEDFVALCGVKGEVAFMVEGHGGAQMSVILMHPYGYEI